MSPTFQVTFDAADPNRLATFWAGVLGYKIQDPPAGFASWIDFLKSIGVPEEDWNKASAIVDPEGSRPRIFFQRVPEPRVAKNRVHLDVNAGGGLSVPVEQRRVRVDAEAQRLTGLGATIKGPVEERGEYWIVLQDPEGNEFCLQ